MNTDKPNAPTFKLAVGDAIVEVTPCFVTGHLLWDYTFCYSDGSGYTKDWHPNLQGAKSIAATQYRVKTGKPNYRAKWIKS